MKGSFENLGKLIESYDAQMTQTMCLMLQIQAISPKSAGRGESKRADFLDGLLRSWGLETKRYDYADDTGIPRPNIITKFGGLERTIWFVAHTDTFS